ncbi:hypothetical protein COLO4_26963 [Corchorus olitorius]|uniref:F-box domain-containing protein n=1 Tax=Corchorus olitorius TaxID=93759 RepID=A0A1R3HT93_9ROSI|nr:hypothetical protein COLO4_26963 [Corchorus olitorius]
MGKKSKIIKTKNKEKDGTNPNPRNIARNFDEIGPICKSHDNIFCQFFPLLLLLSNQASRNTTNNDDLVLNPKDYISQLPNDVLYHIISKLPFEFAVQTARLSTQWKDLWQKALLAMVEDTSLEDIDITLINFLEQVSEFNRPGFKFNFGEGRFLLVAITPNNKLVFDFSSAEEEELSRPFDLLLPLNLLHPYRIEKQPSAELIEVKSLHLKSLSPLACKAVLSLLSEKKLPFLQSLIIEKCNGLQSLNINKAFGLSTLIVLDCPRLEVISLFQTFYFKSLRYRGRSLLYYGDVVPEDLMLDFRDCLGYNYDKADRVRLNSFLYTIRGCSSLTICRWLFQSIYRRLSSLTVSFTRGHFGSLKELWWIDCSMEAENVDALVCFLRECYDLERLYVTIDPTCYKMTNTCKLVPMNWPWSEKLGRLKLVKLVKLEGFPNEKEEIIFAKRYGYGDSTSPKVEHKNPNSFKGNYRNFHEIRHVCKSHDNEFCQFIPLLLLLSNQASKNTTRNDLKLKLKLDRKDYISGLPNDIVYHIISKLPFEVAVQTARLSTQWKDVWQKALLAMVEDPSLEDIDITLTNFIEQLSESNRPRQNWGFKFNFGGGGFFLVAITSNNTLVFDFSSIGEQELSKPFDLLLSLNLPKRSKPFDLLFSLNLQPPEHIKVKSLHLKSVNSLVCEALSSFLSKKKLSFLKSLTIEKCNELQSLEINKAVGLTTLMVLDCPKLEFLKMPCLFLYGVVRDAMLDFRQGVGYNHNEIFNSLRSITCMSIYNDDYWVYSSSRDNICDVREFWWIDSSIEENQVKFLLRFLKVCPHLERLYVTIDPNCYPNSCKLTKNFTRITSSWRPFMNEGKCSRATKLSHLKLVKLEGFPNEEVEIKFVRKLIPLFEGTPEIIAKSLNGTCLRQFVKVAWPEKNGKNRYGFKVLKHNAFPDHSHMNFLL